MTMRAVADGISKEVDSILPANFRKFIENRFYKEINDQAVFENFIDDKSFYKNPVKHAALYSDHGVVHVQDVAKQILQVLDRVNGVLIPFREMRRLQFMKGYGVAVAYLHDIGMCDMTTFGRKMHPEFAAQAVFHGDLGEKINELWDENTGNIPWRLLSLHAQGYLKQDPKLVMREMLALSCCHSKTKFPVRDLNNPLSLRKKMMKILSTNLRYQFQQEKVRKLQKKLLKAQRNNGSAGSIRSLQQQLTKQKIKLHQSNGQSPETREVEEYLKSHYNDFSKEAYQWLQNDHPDVVAVAEDVIDTIRALRCADAFRQRGTVLKTSGGYEVYVDQNTANAIYALRNSDNSQLYLFEADKSINAGEANMASSELDPDCNLRVSFHRGSFANEKAVVRAAYNAATVINDIQQDVIQSFKRKDITEVKKPSVKMNILIEGVEDNPQFAGLICTMLQKLNPSAARKCRPVASLQGADLEEVNRYLNGRRIDAAHGDKKLLPTILERVLGSGHRINSQEVEQLFYESKIVKLKRGEILINAGTPSGFVYIPFGDGLKVARLGGYNDIKAKPWVPVGNSGVIRGSVRNADVIAEKDVEVLILPKEVYLRHWYKPYSREELPSLAAVKTAGELKRQIEEARKAG